MALLPCGCRTGDYDERIVFAVCPQHDPTPTPAPKCAEGCNRPDAESCKRASWSVQCVCSCHPATRLFDAHEAIEGRLFRRDIEAERWAEYFTK